MSYLAIKQSLPVVVTRVALVGVPYQSALHLVAAVCMGSAVIMTAGVYELGLTSFG